jgi:hypothetical protein
MIEARASHGILVQNPHRLARLLIIAINEIRYITAFARVIGRGQTISAKLIEWRKCCPPLPDRKLRPFGVERIFASGEAHQPKLSHYRRATERKLRKLKSAVEIRR